MHSTTKRLGCCSTILDAPPFARDEATAHHRPPRHATIWRVSMSPALAFKLLCDTAHLYPIEGRRPRVGGMLEHDGSITLYLWPSYDPDTALLMLLLDYGATRLADTSQWTGQAWIAGDLLCKVIAVLSHRDHYRMTHHEPRLLRDEVPGWLLSLPRQGKP